MILTPARRHRAMTILDHWLGVSTSHYNILISGLGRGGRCSAALVARPASTTNQEASRSLLLHCDWLHITREHVTIIALHQLMGMEQVARPNHAVCSDA